jgi:hypothetical protein
MSAPTNTPADAQGHREGENRERPQTQLDLRRDVLMPDLRGRAVAEHRDPEEVDPISDDEDALRLASLGGSSNLD